MLIFRCLSVFETESGCADELGVAAAMEAVAVVGDDIAVEFVAVVAVIWGLSGFLDCNTEQKRNDEFKGIYTECTHNELYSINEVSSALHHSTKEILLSIPSN